MQRDDPPLAAPEREMLEGWLHYHRRTLEMKCAGLTAEQCCERSVPPSSLSLIGLVRHMADVERGWFQRFVGGADKTTEPPIFYSATNLEGDFDDVDPQRVEDDIERWRTECRRSDEVLARYGLDDTRPAIDRDGIMSVRWVVVHMIEEYARHNGHADLLRERIDGTTGD